MLAVVVVRSRCRVAIRPRLGVPVFARRGWLVLFAALTAACGGGSGGSPDGSTNIAPIAQAVADPHIGRPPLHVVLDGSGSTDADGKVVSYGWSFGDGTSAGGQSVTHTFDKLGSYQAQLTVTDDDGASASATLRVEVVADEPPQARATADPESGEAPLAVTFSAAGSTDPDGIVVLYQWDFGDGGNPAEGTTVTHRYEEPGDYDVTLRVVDDNGLSDEAPISVHVDPPVNRLPTASFTATPTTGPAPLVSQFDASASSDPDGQIVDFQWNFGDGTGLQAGAIVSHTFTTEGIYGVHLTVTDDFGAAVSESHNVIVGARPVAAIGASPESGTPPLTVEFYGSGSSDSDGTVVAYLWDFDDGGTATGPTPNHTFEDPGQYQVSLTVTDNDGIPSNPVTFAIRVTQDPDSLSFRDFFDTNSIGRYVSLTGPGQSVSYDGDAERMQVISGLGTVEIARNLPAEEEALYRIRFEPTQANSSAASFTLRLEETDTTYYEVYGVASVDGGASSGGIRKVVNGAVAAGGEAVYSKPRGYTNGLAYSVNVYFSPGRLTAEFTELSPRVLSINPSDRTPVKVGRMRVLLQDQDGYLDDIVKEPLGPATLQYYVAFGDSITEGTGDDAPTDGVGYPIALQDEFQNELITSHVVFNEGFGGYRSDQGLDIIDEVMARHPRAQFVTVQLGSNDAMLNSATTAQFKANMQAILDVIKGAGKTPYLAKLPPPKGKAADIRIDDYNKAIDELVDENHLIVVPPDFHCFFAAHPGLIGADEIHPTGEGYVAMAQLWYKLIDLGQSATKAEACVLP